MKKDRWFKNSDCVEAGVIGSKQSIRHKRKGAVIAFTAVNLFVVAALISFQFYCNYMWNGGGADKSVCFFMRLFNLYCPFCGVTRSIWYLTRLDIVNAIIFSPFAVTAACGFVYCDVRAFVALLKGKEHISRISPWISKLLVTVLVATFIVRNLLLVFCGYDPLGNIGDFWQSIF